jgi:hypothetical protein
MEAELDERDLMTLNKAIREIERQMEACKELLGLQDF